MVGSLMGRASEHSAPVVRIVASSDGAHEHDHRSNTAGGGAKGEGEAVCVSHDFKVACRVSPESGLSRLLHDHHGRRAQAGRLGEGECGQFANGGMLGWVSHGSCLGAQCSCGAHCRIMWPVAAGKQEHYTIDATKQNGMKTATTDVLHSGALFQCSMPTSAATAVRRRWCGSEAVSGPSMGQALKSHMGSFGLEVSVEGLVITWSHRRSSSQRGRRECASDICQINNRH